MAFKVLFQLSKIDLVGGRAKVQLAATVDDLDDPSKGSDALTTWRSVNPDTYLGALAIWQELAKRLASNGFTVSSDGLQISHGSCSPEQLLEAEMVGIKASMKLNDFGSEHWKKKGKLKHDWKNKEH